MKRFIFFCLCCAMGYVTQAQTYTNSQIDTSSRFVGDNVIIRNYNNTHEVIAIRNVDPFILDQVTGNPTKCYNFMIRNIATGVITNIGALPEEYMVKDIQFVTLRDKTDTSQKTTFCCFCGNRAHVSGGYWTIGGQYITTTSDSGFVGFFAMPQAISPSSSYSIKLRNVENTKQLTKLTAYAEYHGYYYSANSCTYIDNAVLDVMGFPNDTVNKPSCLCRVKFYPEYNNGDTRWDNNVRTPAYPTEVMQDVISTDNYVITASTVDNDSSKIWLRCSVKETEFFLGGRQLNSNVFVLDISTITGSGMSSSSAARFSFPVRLCRGQGNTFTVSFYALNSATGGYSGLFTYPMSYNGSTLTLTQGAYDKGSYTLKDVVYLPRETAMAMLVRNGSTNNVVRTVKFIGNNISTKEYTLNMARPTITSITAWRNSNYSYILFGGSLSGSNKCMALVGQRFGVTTDACLGRASASLSSCNISSQTTLWSYSISNRYPNNPVNYPVTNISLSPSNVVYGTICSQ